MPIRRQPPPAILASLAAAVSLGICTVMPATVAANESIDEIVVTSQRRAQAIVDHAGNIHRVGETDLGRVRHQHIHELLTRVPGVWIGRGSGQEHLTAIRSPVLTGAGSCGAFLFLEDGIPIRPAGFCNANALFEIDTEQARSIEVIRGPGNALYGSNALHGIINVLMPTPEQRSAVSLGVEAGANDFLRLGAELPFDPDSPFMAAILFTHDGGFREESGYRQIKAHFKHASEIFGGAFVAALSISDLDQETAGFILGEDSYKDPALNRQNLNPGAFRDARSQRLYGQWNADIGRTAIDVRPYIRHSEMQFLQHFLPGQPLEENGQTSAGVMSSVTLVSEESATIFGFDFEWSDVHLRETQFGPTEGSAFLQETRPQGKHYDYEVLGLAIAAYVQADFDITQRLTVAAGLRLEYLRYEYDNQMLDGDTRDDGTACGFGGCLYTRPADRDDSFNNVVPKLSANFAILPNTRLYATLARGFRAPQMTELYRLQSGQSFADLGSEQIDSFEIGLRVVGTRFDFDASLYTMKKRDSVIRDANGFNISGAQTRHDGIEATVNWQMNVRWRLAFDASFARHRYNFDLIAARGENFVAGRDVDTAPRWLGSAEVFFDATDRFNISAEWTAIGEYYLDAENRFDYPGHQIVNLRADLYVSPVVGIGLRINNIGDEAIADRADYAFGNYRYFPGRGREVFIELRYSATRNESL